MITFDAHLHETPLNDFLDSGMDFNVNEVLEMQGSRAWHRGIQFTRHTSSDVTFGKVPYNCTF